MTSTPRECAALLAELAPAVVDIVREEARQQAGDLTVSQLRALGYLTRHPDASLSDVALVVGLTLPATSRLVDQLVGAKLVTRREAADDRRKVTLNPTSAGRATAQAARKASHARLAALLDGLAQDELDALGRALDALRARLPGGEVAA